MKDEAKKLVFFAQRGKVGKGNAALGGSLTGAYPIIMFFYNLNLNMIPYDSYPASCLLDSKSIQHPMYIAVPKG